MKTRIAKICFISDTHGHHKFVDIPKDCEIIIHCGDISMLGTQDQVKDFLDWFTVLPAEHKVMIAGNHDIFFEPSHSRHEAMLQGGLIQTMFPRTLIDDYTDKGLIYLENESTEIKGIKIYGSPYTPEFYNWAFNLDRGEKLKACWSMIPEDTDILVTHGPPANILDYAVGAKNHVGCQDLAMRIPDLKNLKINSFGHIHESYGVEFIDNVYYINASILNLSYRVSNKPIVVSYFDDGSIQLEK